MSKQRKQVETYILKLMKAVDPSGENEKLYAAKFKKMSDTDFDKWMKSIRDGKAKLSIYTANIKNNLSIVNLKAVADKYGITLFDHLKIWDDVGQRYFMTPTKYLILNIPVRRLKQTLSEKMSVPDNDRVTSLQTGQVVGPSKGSSLSLIEAQTLIGKGLNNVVDEFWGIRGGNPEAWASMSSTLEETGNVSIGDAKSDTRPRAVETSKAYLLARHIDNNM